MTLIGSKAIRQRRKIRENGFLNEDGHNHTWRSDGNFGILDLVVFHHLLGFKRLVITDHDFLSGEKNIGKAWWVKTVCRLLGVEVEYGVEFTSRLDIGFLGLKKKHAGIHLVGRGFDPDHPIIRAVLRMMAESRMDRAGDLLLEIKRRNPDLVMPEFLRKKDGVMTSTDVAMQVCVENPQLELLAFAKLLQTDENYHMYYEKADTEELIRAIKESGGKAILAHPVKALRKNYRHLDEIAGRLAPLGLDGIEVFVRGQSPGQMAEIIEVCIKHGLRIYAGSDTHWERDLVDYAELMVEYSEDPEVLLWLEKYGEMMACGR